MIKVLHHTQIDSVKWNDCLLKVEDASFYALYEYLTSICEWEAIVLDNGVDYELIVPLPFKKKFCLKYLYQPFFCQQLGVYSKIVLEQNQLDQIKKIIKNEYHFGSLNWFDSQGLDCDFNVRTRINYVLDLNKSFDELKLNFNSNRRRVLNKLNKTVVVEVSSSTNSIHLIIDNYRNELGARFSEVLPCHYEALKIGLLSLGDVANVQIVQAFDSGALISEALFVIYKNKIVYLLGYNKSEFSRSSGLTSCFVNVIEVYSNQEYILDFEGGEIDGIAQFYASLGGVKSCYYSVEIKSVMQSLVNRIR